MFVLLLATCVLAAVSAQSAPKCCTPSKWEGIESAIGGYGYHGDDDTLYKDRPKPRPRKERMGLIFGMTMVSYDGDDQQIAAVTNATVGEKQFALKVIQNFQKKKMYVQCLKTGRCRTVPLKRPFRKACIPGAAKALGKSYFGAGDNKLNFESYMLGLKTRKGKLQLVMSVTDGCIPVSEALFGGSRRGGMVEALGFVNITPGIKDKSVFTPSKKCSANTDLEMPFELDELQREHRWLGF